MAKARKGTKAQREAEALKLRKATAEYAQSGYKREVAQKLGLIPFYEERVLTQTEKATVQTELTAISDVVTALKEKAIALWKKDESNAKELGEILIKIKAALEHGEFGKWCQKAGLEQNRVSYCLRVAAPQGNKVQAAKERVKKSPRAKALRSVLKKVAELYDLAEEGQTERAKELFREIKAYIEAKIITALDKPKAKGAAA